MSKVGQNDKISDYRRTGQIQSLPVVVYDAVKHCELGCGAALCERHIHRRTIRDQVVTVCVGCINAHPKQIPRNFCVNLVQLLQAATTRNVAMSAPRI
eukprot:119227-Amphidinium_carterae.1